MKKLLVVLTLLSSMATFAKEFDTRLPGLVCQETRPNEYARKISNKVTNTLHRYLHEASVDNGISKENLKVKFLKEYSNNWCFLITK